MNFKYLWLVGFIFLLAACGTPPTATPLPTPEAIKVYYPSLLQPWADKLARCGQQNSSVALYFIQSGSQETDSISDGIWLELGPSAQEKTATFTAQLGWEQIVVAVNVDNPLTVGSQDQLRQIFSGQMLNWENGSGEPIQVWVLPNDEPVRFLFDRLLGLNALLAPDAMQAPDPMAMLQAISVDPNAVGYLPQNILTTSVIPAEKVKLIQLPTSLNQELRLPVLAITPDEPTGILRSILVCAQSSVEQ